MTDEVHVHVNCGGNCGWKSALEQMQTLLLNVLVEIKQQGVDMSKELDDLTAEVAATKTVVDSAVVLIQGLRQQIIDAGTDPVALQALTESLKATETALATAVATPGP